ncbi:hypothetical protein [Paenibacillus lautus]|uniref:hypothetical protein n=1 Tax=Paenibacillus lautus TaxID=1401 RepID=UPI001C7DD117|nr:hypothetical protein [Paenibacillus lautus]MBX4145979.1 hypothetical protein [Paenibacillus lautus]
MNLGRKIYWDSITGGIIIDRMEMEGSVRESTVEEDFQTYIKLAERAPETVLGILLDHGKYSQDFDESVSFHIVESANPVEGITTLIGDRHYDLEFEYPDPENPETPQEPQPALSKQLTTLKTENESLKSRVSDVEMTITEILLFNEGEVIADA